MSRKNDSRSSEEDESKVLSDRRWFLKMVGASGLSGLAASASAAGSTDDSSAFREAEEVDSEDYANSPALPPSEALDTFKLPDGFEIELVASEPLVQSPIDMKWDAKGRLWVVEMPDYMAHDPTEEKGDGRIEDTEWTPEEFEMSELQGWGDSVTDEEPNGRIVVLEDTDGDGKMNESTVFLDNLTLPRNVAFVPDGVLVLKDGDLVRAQDTTGDLTADTEEVLVENFFDLSMVEHTDNGMVYLMDNWMYNARSNLRLQYQDKELTVDETHERGQWGMTQDNYGRPFYTFNSDWLRTDLVPAEYYRRGSYSAQEEFDYGVERSIVDSGEVWTSRKNPGTNRAYGDDFHRPDGRMNSITAVSGPGIYRGDLFDDEIVNQAFSPEAQGPAIGQFDVQRDGIEIEAEHITYDDEEWGTREFLTSSDQVSKPVYVKTGPDGALYIADMYNGIFQHINFMTDYLAAYTLRNNLHKVPSAGRIYRIVPEDGEPNSDIPNLDELPAEELATYLMDDNGWTRDTAQRLIVQQSMTGAAPVLRDIIQSCGEFVGAEPVHKMHALWALQGIEEIDAESVFMAMESDHTPLVTAAMRTGEALLETEHAEKYVTKLIEFTSADELQRVVQAAFSLGQVSDSNLHPEIKDALQGLLNEYEDNKFIRHAIWSAPEFDVTV